MVMSPPILWKQPHEHLDFALLSHHYQYAPFELTYTIPLRTDIIQLLSKAGLGAVKQAEQYGLTVDEVAGPNQYAQFYEILLQNKQERHNATPTHTLTELLWLKEHLPHLVRLYLVYSDSEKPIAGSLVFILNARAAMTFYIAHIPEDQSLRPTNLLLFKIMMRLKKEGFEHLDLGTTARLADIDKWQSYLFKESLGGRGTFRRRFLWPMEQLP
jgi:hypothetical protein